MYLNLFLLFTFLTLILYNEGKIDIHSPLHISEKTADIIWRSLVLLTIITSLYLLFTNKVTSSLIGGLGPIIMIFYVFKRNGVRGTIKKTYDQTPKGLVAIVAVMVICTFLAGLFVLATLMQRSLN